MRGAALFEEIRQLISLRFHTLALCFVDMSNTQQETWETWHSVLSILAIGGRKIRSAIKRVSVRGEKDGHWPPSLTAHSLDGLHIDAINIWALFTIYFNGDKMLVHQDCDLFVLEGFALHNVAPVTG